MNKQTDCNEKWMFFVGMKGKNDCENYNKENMSAKKKYEFNCKVQVKRKRVFPLSYNIYIVRIIIYVSGNNTQNSNKMEYIYRE